MATSVLETAAGFLLIFFLPGFGVARALFPEWRWRGPQGLTHVVETLALSVGTSVALTILVGFGLLATSGGFSATWSNPTLEIALTIIAAVALVLAGVRGGFSRHPPAPKPLEPSPGEEGGWELVRRMEELSRRERRLTHALRQADGEGPTVRQLERELDSVRSERDSILRAREAEYAQ